MPTELFAVGILFVKNYSTSPAYNCSTGKIKSQFLPQTMLPFSMVKRSNLRGSRYLLYCGFGWRRMKSPISTVYTVLSLNVRLTVKLPAFSALITKILSISFHPYSFLDVRTADALLQNEEFYPLVDDVFVIFSIVFACKNTKSFGFSTSISVFFYNFAAKLRKNDIYADTETD